MANELIIGTGTGFTITFLDKVIVSLHKLLDMVTEYEVVVSGEINILELAEPVFHLYELIPLPETDKERLLPSQIELAPFTEAVESGTTTFMLSVIEQPKLLNAVMPYVVVVIGITLMVLSVNPLLHR